MSSILRFGAATEDEFTVYVEEKPFTWFRGYQVGGRFIILWDVNLTWAMLI